MSKSIKSITLIASMLFLFGCAANPVTTPAPTPAPQAPGAEAPAQPGTPAQPETPAQPPVQQPVKSDIRDYYPLKANTLYLYEGMGNEYATFDVVVDYLEGNKIQVRENNGGTEIVKVIQVTADAVKVVFSRGETYFRESFLNRTSDKEDIILKAPLTVGTSWKQSDGNTSTITGVDVDVTVPLGTYKAIEVTTKTKGGDNISYYAAGVGLVKRAFKTSTDEITSSLKEIKENAAHSKMMSFYFPNANGKIVRVNRTVDFKTNDISRMVLEHIYREIGKEQNSNVISENTEIKSLYLNADGMVYIDLSKEFVSEMNAGSQFEYLILQSVVNTFGDFYGETKVMLTIEGEPYASGHIELDKFESMTVNYKDVVD
jgi:hypothetical protein